MHKMCVAEYSDLTGWCDNRYGFQNYQCRDIICDWFEPGSSLEFYPLDCLPNIPELAIYGDNETPEATQRAKDFIVNYDAKSK